MTSKIQETLRKFKQLFRFGKGDNYSQFNDDTGILTLHGNARVLKTLQIKASELKSAGLNPASFVSHGLDGALQFAKNLTQNSSLVFAIRKDLDRTEIPNLEIGWSSPATTGNVKIQVEYLWRSINEDTSSTTPDDTITEIIEVSGTANGYNYNTFPLCCPSSTDRIGQIQISRIGGDALDTADDVLNLIGITIKYTSNKLGE